MEKKFTIEKKEHYIHVKMSGKYNFKDYLDSWMKVADTCREKKCFVVLGESDLKKSLTAIEIFEHIDIFKEAGITSDYIVAWVDHNLETIEKLKIIEGLILENNLFATKLFMEIDEAKKWLQNKLEEIKDS